MQSHSKCPLCGSDHLSVLYDCRDNLISGETFPLVRCSSCTFIFTDNVPEESKSTEYYKSEEYISHSNTSKGLIPRLYQKARRLMMKRKHKYVFRINGMRKGSILDIGSGTGHFIDFMKRKGWEAKGIEINEKARQFSKDQFNIETLNPRVISSLKSGSFDIITMWHTLEHFHNPGEYLKESFRLLKEDGHLIVAIPNYKSFDAEFYKENWAAWDVPRHLWHFSPQTIGTITDKYGYRLEKILRLPFDPFYISLLSEKNRRSVFPFIQGMLIGTVSWMTSYLRKFRSSSLVYVFRKKD